MRTTILIAALTLFLCGCPNPNTTKQAQQLDLKLEKQESPPVKGATRQLTLQFGGQGDAMLGAMIEKQSPPTTWHAEPADAVSIDAKTAKVEFKKAGKVKIWATYTQDGKELKSNALTLEVKAEDTAQKK